MISGFSKSRFNIENLIDKRRKISVICIQYMLDFTVQFERGWYDYFETAES